MGLLAGRAGDVEALVELGVRATVIESPVSDLKAPGVRDRPGRDPPARSRCRVLRRGERDDGLLLRRRRRADRDFLRRAYETALEAGATEIAVVDTLGIASPDAAYELVGSMVDLGVPVHWHGHNDFGLATAIPSPPCAPARGAGSTAPSTGWASGPATRVSARSRSR